MNGADNNNKKTTGKIAFIEAFAYKHKIPLFIIIGALALMGPQFLSSDYMVRVISMIFVYVAFGLGLNIMTGYIGQMSLGHAGFVGVGAYTAAILTTEFGMQFFIAAPLAAIMAGIFGLLIGLPSLRLTGPYLAIVTMGFGEIMRMIFLNWTSVTGGALGMKNIPKPAIFGYELDLKNKGYLYLIMAVVLLAVYITWALTRSKYGRAFGAIKGDELAAKMMGVNITKNKVLGFVVSAMICGFVGGYYAQMQRYIDSNTFLADMSIMIVSVVVVGGLGTIRGPFLGALIIVTMPEIFRFLEGYRFIVYGLLLVIMMQFRPNGLLGWKSTLPYRLPKGTKELLSEEKSQEVKSKRVPQKVELADEKG